MLKTYTFPLEGTGGGAGSGVESGPLIDEQNEKAFTLAGRERTFLARIIVWGGSATLLAVTFIFASIAATSGPGAHGQSFTRIGVSFLVSLVIYATFDSLYVIFLEIPYFRTPLFSYHGTDRIYKEEADPVPRGWYLTFPAFFVLAAIAITVLAVLPALDTLDYWIAATNGWTLGMFVYATLGLVQIWTVARFPMELAVLQTLWGASLCFLVSISTLGFTQLVPNGDATDGALVANAPNATSGA